MPEKIKPGKKDAIIVVDIQNDFLPGGSLGVKDGDQVVPVLNRLIPRFKTAVFSRDWHPPGHVSFSEEPGFVDMSWPGHCVQGTPGAEFAADLDIPEDAIIVSKGDDPEREAYSGFQGTGLGDRLRELGIERVFIGGLATDYCVKATALDALENGFEAFVLEDAVRGVDVPEGSAGAALEEMKTAGVRVINSGDLE